jgi:hypothetical protein
MNVLATTTQRTRSSARSHCIVGVKRRVAVTARDITTLDRQALNVDPSSVKPGRAVRIIEKAGLNATDFMAEVRRALPQR